MSGYSDQVVVITGTSKGLGMQLAQMFTDSGSTVFGCSRGEFELKTNRYHHTAVDVGNEEQVRNWIRYIRKEAGRIDLLVCNASVVESILPMTLTPSKLLEAYLRTSVTGTFFTCREAGKVMAAQRSGRVVAISSTMTRLHEPGTSLYSASKSAIEEMIRVLARELAGANVTCNIVAPGLLTTEASEAFGAEWRERMLGLQSIKRAILPSEIFHAIQFYASPAAASITGQTLYMGIVN